MAVASFEVFCADLCALMGVPAPSLEASPAGIVGFTVEYRGATVGFIKPDETAEPGVLMMVTLGSPPADLEPEVLRVLMDSNFLMMGMNSPAYARNPLTREISMHRSFTLMAADVHAVLEGVVNAADTTANFLQTYFLERKASAGVPA